MIKECFSFDVSSLCDFRALFLRALSQPVLSDLWVLFTAGLVRSVGIVYSRSCQICGYCLQPVLSDLWVLFTASVRFDVSGPVLSPGGDSVRPGLNRLVSGGVSDGNRLLVTTSACTLTGGLVLCDWLHSVTRGRGLWLIQSA